MDYSRIGDFEISRFGVGTKSLPTQDASRVERLDQETAAEIFDKAVELGVNYFDTSYSNLKGEAESFLGEHFKGVAREKHYTATSFFEMVDPRFEYVFNKQLIKLETDCIDFYRVEGVSNLTRMRDIESGAVDYLFEQKEAGKIALLGFSSELNAENLKEYLSLRPWDFVRMRINYFDWFNKGVRECYEIAAESGVPIIAHASMRIGNRSTLKPEALALLKDYDAQRPIVDWNLRFVKSLEHVRTLTCNMNSVREVEENVAVFEDGNVLSTEEFDLLEQVAKAQRTIVPKA